jgi:hypothetical protein
MIDELAWRRSSSTHYRELAGWLREIGGKCRLPNPQRELLSLARRNEIRADHLERPRVSARGER